MSRISSSQRAHRGYQIQVALVSCKTTAFSITRNGQAEFAGYTDEPVTPRIFVGQLAVWLDHELAAIEAIL